MLDFGDSLNAFLDSLFGFLNDFLNGLFGWLADLFNNMNINVS
jgi:hypothetical protein